MPLKIIQNFFLGGEGWSEVHYHSADTIEEYTGIGNAAFANGSPYFDMFSARRALLQSDALNTHVRVTDLSVPGSYLSYDIPASIGRGKYITTDDKAAEVFSSLLITLRSGTLVRRRLYLGGIPEEIVNAPQSYKPTKEWKAALGAYFAIVAKAPYACRTRPRANPLTDPPITSFLVLPNARVAEVTPLVRPDTNPLEWYVIIRGLRNPQGWNGVHRATVAVGGGAMVLGPARRTMKSAPVFAFDPAAKVTVYRAFLAALTSADVGRIVSRRRGRPFGLPRGRR